MTTDDDEEDEHDGTPRGVLALGARDDEDEARDDDDARCGGDLGWRADADADADAR